jgi:periplasmic divalent cation tolerance protein
MHPDTVILVLSTWPAGSDPAPFASALVEAGVAACVNLLPEMESIYRWEGRVEQARERQVVIKTLAGRLEPLRQQMAQRHPYQVPELLVIEVAGGGEAYLRWVRESAG